MNDHSSLEPPIQKTATEARQGATPGIVRWVLGFSLFGVILGMAIGFWLFHGV